MKKWEKLQWYIAEKINEIFDCRARPTVGSGNATELGDVHNPYFLVECKERNTKNVTINIDVWDKNKSDLPVDSTRIPFLALENKDGRRFIVIEPEDFFDIVQKGEDNDV